MRIRFRVRVRVRVRVFVRTFIYRVVQCEKRKVATAWLVYFYGEQKAATTIAMTMANMQEDKTCFNSPLSFPLLAVFLN